MVTHITAPFGRSEVPLCEQTPPSTDYLFRGVVDTSAAGKVTPIMPQPCTISHIAVILGVVRRLEVDTN